MAFVAGLIGIIKIGTARALEQIARCRRFVAKLPGGTGNQRARQKPVVSTHNLVAGQCCISHQGADSQATIACHFNCIKAEPIHVDEMRGLLYIKLHKVEEVSAARDKFGFWV
jgi:hypothetical protein